MKQNKSIKYYMDLPWTYTVEIDKDKKGKKNYIISVNELPGIKTDAYSRQEAFKSIKEAMGGLFELSLEIGKEIPIPINKNKFKGNITYKYF